MPNPPRVLEGYSRHTLGDTATAGSGFGVRVSVYGHLGTDATARCEGCAAAVGRARLPSCGPRARARLNDRMLSLQGLELLVTVLLARNRQPPPTVAAGVPLADLAAELITLPSGLLAMVCEAIVKLTVRLAAAGARVGCMGDGRGPTRSRRMHGACPSIGSRARLSGSSACMRSAGSTPSSTGVVLCRFAMWPEPAGTPSIRALCVVVRDLARCGPGAVPESPP